jgi:hypothetical protein
VSDRPQEDLQSLAWLPDGLFSNQTPSFGTFWKPFEWEFFFFYGHLVYILCGHLLYYMAIRYMLWAFVMFCPILVFCVNKNLATLILRKYEMSTYLESLTFAFERNFFPNFLPKN